ncbi:hypothetical protein ACOSJ1_EBGNOMHC_03763 [Bacillus mycoides KBAB4]|nr:hypothetical protein ACOSJ1_EBGNOMHC_03763 [Bacillus mycoides KBAB4]
MYYYRIFNPKSSESQIIYSEKQYNRKEITILYKEAMRLSLQRNISVVEVVCEVFHFEQLKNQH